MKLSASFGVGLTQRWVSPTLFLLVIALFLGRVALQPGFVEDRDGLFFTRALDHYSVADLSPQWPGYPVYIWVGKLFNLVTGDPERALHLVSALASTLCLIPVYGITLMAARRLHGARVYPYQAACLSVLFWSFVPLSLIDGSRIFSDPLALLLSLAMAWYALRALTTEPRNQRSLLWAFVLGGLMLGVRASYAPLLLFPLAIALYKRARGHLTTGQVLLSCAATAAVVGLWLGWQILVEGQAYFDAAAAHLKGHFGIWGGGVTTDSSPATRPLRFLETLSVYGLGGWRPGAGPLRALVTFGWAALLFSAIYRLARARGMLSLVVLWAAPYGLWLFTANDVDLARYYFPLVALCCVLAPLALRSVPALAIGVGFAVLLGTVSIPLARMYRVSPPIGRQTAAYLVAQADLKVDTLFVSGAAHFARTYTPPLTVMRVTSNDLARRIQEREHGGELYATGFALEAAKAGPDWKAVARFCQDPFLESRGPYEATLYLYEGEKVSTTSALPCYPLPVGLEN